MYSELREFFDWDPNQDHEVSLRYKTQWFGFTLSQMKTGNFGKFWDALLPKIDWGGKIFMIKQWQ